MNLKNWFLGQKLWLRGGIIGVIVCLILFMFYYAVFSLLFKIYGEGEQNLPISGVITTMSVVTGHMFVFFSHDVVPTGLICKATEPVCADWVSKDSIHGTPSPSLVPLTMENTPGYCTDYRMEPTSTCSDKAEKVGFWMFALMLTLIYFCIGAAVGRSVEKKNFRII